MKGLVIKNTGSWYTVLAEDGRMVESKVKGNFRLKGIRSTNPVAVGDRVQLVMGTDNTALISKIEERRNYIIRRSINLSKQSHIIAANVDLACLVVTTVHPETSTTFIDRFLASAEAYRVPVVLLFNKCDLLTEEEKQGQDYLLAVYRHIGYDCRVISAETGQGVDELKSLLQGKITLFSGHSGVGKSTLINRLLPGANLRTAALSEAWDVGQHTTTYSEMLPMGDAWLIDTPGIKGFGTFDMEPEEITSYFRDIFQLSKDCRFSNCSHTHEPGCAVLEALELHQLAPTRYQSYLSMMEDKDQSRYREAQ